MHMPWNRPVATDAEARWRKFFLAVIVAEAVFTGAVVLAVLRVWFLPSPVFIIIVAATFGSVSTTLGAAMLVRRRSGGIELLARTSDRICPRCRYDLTTTAEGAPCPECGTPWTAAELKRTWDRAYGR
ncbi:MAG: hypothetical protein JNM07_10825 [Phycisphaerae bacterium]|nr:hypothetical protein [Phycisphaerae bacterium]